MKIQLPTTPAYQVQVTTNGTSWTTVSAVSNYYSVLNGLDLGAGNTPLVTAPVTFILSNPADGMNIEGIRVIGTYAGGRAGYLSVGEMDVFAVPEPSTYAMLGLGVLALFCVRRYRKISA